MNEELVELVDKLDSVVSRKKADIEALKQRCEDLAQERDMYKRESHEFRSKLDELDKKWKKLNELLNKEGVVNG